MFLNIHIFLIGKSLSMKKLLLLSFCVLLTSIFYNCNNVEKKSKLQNKYIEPTPEEINLDDYKKNIMSIKSIKIGEQVWMQKNLNVNNFRNGDPIPHAKTFDEWKIAGENRKPAWCYYYNNEENGEKYGKLYNWYAVNDPRGLAPKGWKIPDKEDFEILVTNVISATHLKSKTGWSNSNGNGTNKSDFTSLPAGGRNSTGEFDGKGEMTRYWSNTESNNIMAWNLYLHKGISSAAILDLPKSIGLSVRCIKDGD